MVRPIKELLELMLINIDSLQFGLCNLTFILLNKEIITVAERFELEAYVKHNRPSKYSSINAYKVRKYHYYWSSGNKYYRIKWLKKHIKLNSK